MTLNGHSPGRNPAPQQGPDLMLANPLCCHPGERARMQFCQVKRRELITLLGGAAAWPLAARAQQPERMRLIGMLESAAADRERQSLLVVFQEELRKLGWTDGKNIRFDIRWGSGDFDLVRSHAASLVRLGPDVIFSSGAPATAALQRATSAIPIVFVMVADPVGGGFIQNLAHPGGNITGFTNHEYTMVGKWLELLKEIAPSVQRIAVIQNPDNPSSAGYLRQVETAAPSSGVQLSPGGVRDAAQIGDVIDGFAREANGGLVVLSDLTTNAHRDLIIALAARHHLPAIYLFRYFVASGGLVSYGADAIDLHRRAAPYVARILAGQKPANLPVQAPTKFELVINLKTARALGLEISSTLLARADGVIE
jgi:putative ABC transport system substrate-binding protein